MRIITQVSDKINDGPRILFREVRKAMDILRAICSSAFVARIIACEYLDIRLRLGWIGRICIEAFAKIFCRSLQSLGLAGVRSTVSSLGASFDPSASTSIKDIVPSAPERMPRDARLGLTMPRTASEKRFEFSGRA
jgi:hypothetical protein